MNAWKRAALGALFGGSLVLTPVGVASAGAEPVSGPLRGIVVDPTGNPLANVTVDVTAFPAHRPEADIFSEIAIGTAVSDSNGRFELTAAAPGRQGVAFPTGELDLQFQVVNEQGNDFLVSALTKPPAGPGQAWRAGTRRSMGVDNARRTSVIKLVAPSSGLATSRKVGEANADEGNFRPVPINMCPNTTVAPQWAYTGDTADREVPLQRIKTRDRTTWGYNWQTTKGTTIEWAFSGARGAFSGGLTNIESQTSSAGMVNTGGGNVDKMVMGTFRFKRYRLYCASTTWPYAAQPTDDYRWMPALWTGGSSKVDAPINWSCNASYKITSSATELWVARSTGVKFVEWISLAGVGLNNVQYNNTQTNDQMVRLTYYKRSSYAKFALCGRNNVPTAAIQVQEVAP